ncbi:uncharacterized protein PGTG_14042 [Puccinia graminis f. sp. tritici CRL 75-36-700-3]|uniref:BTB domain-containing protein n=1 Tax=Puccinia graminis f. sp. tritici (strain CRL 75-36-700-3 / race SCCL) TaxID=418459 RepID=E3KVY9_PUCGT|nr:uncharacterized protein PGTG_14042 [Puccinia graminis f. sp. tritici CRL 75-36-700-3]EFP88464.2 hypothetical protein PGTG_14042 [Puccinia graminis f. sp. tritici CRL 75-36-700-3]
MKPNQSNNGLILDINIHDVYQSGDINCLRRFLNTIETTCKKTSLISSTINRKDQSGRTLLHKLAASRNESDSIEWLELLAQNHLLQLNIPDLESGWTPLHRALYHGNLRFAKVLIDQLECDLNTKDHEGLSAFDLYHSTIDGSINWISSKPSQAENQQPHTDLFTWGSNRNFVLGIHDDGDRHHPERIHLKRSISSSSQLDPISSSNHFISNPLNFVAIGRLHTALITSEGELRVCGFGSGGRLGLSTSSKSNAQDQRPTAGISAETQFTFAPVKRGGLAQQKVKFVALGQDHTVVITNPGQVYTFGMNRFGQLGYGPESAGASIENMIQVEPKRVLGLLKKVDVIGAAASRWHTAVFSSDSLFTWGANRGQLGYHNPHSLNSLASIQITPRKVAIAHTSIIQLSCTSYETAYLCENSSEVYVLKAEVTIRVVFPFDRFPSDIQVSGMPSTHQGHTPATRILQLDSSDQTLAAVSSMGDVYIVDLENPNPLENPINYVNMSSSPHRSNISTTPTGPAFKPRRIWCSTRSTTAAKHVAVGLDGDVIITTMSGHVYISYRRSAVNAPLKSLDTRSTEPSVISHPKKNYKFQRVQYLQRVSRVAANPTGSYAAIRMDVQLREIQQSLPEEKITLASRLASMLPHLKKYASSVPELHTVPSAILTSKMPSDLSTSGHFRSGSTSPSSEVHLDADEDVIEEEEDREDLVWDSRVGSALFGLSLNWSDDHPTLDSGDIFLVANSGEKILVHRFILCSRSLILDQILNNLTHVDGISYHPGETGEDDDDAEQGSLRLPTLRFDQHMLLTLLLFTHYIYTDTFPTIWDNRVWPQIEHAHQEFLSNTRSSGKPKHAIIHQLNEAKEGLKSLARSLGFPALELSLMRLGKATPKPLLSNHFRMILPTLGLSNSSSEAHDDSQANPQVDPDHDFIPNFQSSNLNPDMELELKDGEILTCHSILMRAQCPFFRLMYDQEVWVTGRRRAKVTGNSNLIRIDMGHLSKKVMQVVLRHIYTDEADDLFLAKDFLSLNDYIDFVFDVMSVANELMMDKLKYICSVVLRRCVNLSNVTAIASEAEFYRADSLKETCMNYMIYNLEALFEDKGLIKIPNDLLGSISSYLKRVQTDKFPISRSTRIIEELMADNSQFLIDLDLPKSKLVLTTRHWKSFHKSLTHQSSQALPDLDITFDKRISRGSVAIDPHQLITGSSFQPSFSPPPDPVGRNQATHPDTSAIDSGPGMNGTPSRTLESVHETMDDDAPFVMDELDGAVHSTTKAVGKMKLGHSSAPHDSSAWAAPVKKVTPIDLRMVTSSSKQRGSFGPSNSQLDTLPSLRLPSDLTPNQKLSQREKRRQSAEASKSKPDSSSTSAAQSIPSKAPAWRSMSGGSSDRKIAGPGGQGLPSLMSNPSLSCSPSSSQPPVGLIKNVQATGPLVGRVQGAVVPRNPEPNDPASAIGASVITPTRAVNGIGASNTFRRALAGQDTPWTNYVSTSTQFVFPGTSASPLDSSSNPVLGSQYENKFEEHTLTLGGSHGIENTSGTNQTMARKNTSNSSQTTTTNFSTIQELQAKESWALYGPGKQKPKLAEIQEEENRRLMEKKQEEQFLKWFEEESLRLQQQQQLPQANSRPKKSAASTRNKTGSSSNRPTHPTSSGNSTITPLPQRPHPKDKKVTQNSDKSALPEHPHKASNKPPPDLSSTSAVHHPELPNPSPKGKKKAKANNNKAMLSNSKQFSTSSTPTSTATTTVALTPSDKKPSSMTSVPSSSSTTAATNRGSNNTQLSHHHHHHHQDEHLPTLHHQNSSRVKAN